MSVRTPELSPIPSLDKLDNLNIPILWHRLDCQLITPLYGGGVHSTVVDTKMPIRTSSIRGQLRFWWRLLACHKWKINNIANTESKLWGGMSDGDTDGQAGQVLLKVSGTPKENIINSRLVSYDDKYFSKLKYALFPAHNESNSDLKPHKLLKADGIDGIEWQLQFAFAPTISEEQKEQVIETLQWWANFGGLGFRSRRGLGAFYVRSCPDFPQICQRPTDDDISQANCQLVLHKDKTDALNALGIAIKKLSDFRQALNIGRNEPSDEARTAGKPAGRSRWPEPDALRRIHKTHAPEHQPEHKAGNIFPRALFGLPIIYHFNQRDYKGEPDDTTVKPTQGDRLASPLILRPIYAGEKNKTKQWQAGALLLPYQHILDMEVQAGTENYPIWEKDKAQSITPIKDNLPKNKDADPLQAFLTYFAK